MNQINAAALSNFNDFGNSQVCTDRAKLTRQADLETFASLVTVHAVSGKEKGRAKGGRGHGRPYGTCLDSHKAPAQVPCSTAQHSVPQAIFVRVNGNGL